MLNRLIIISLLLVPSVLEARAIKLAQRYDSEPAIANEFENVYKSLNATSFKVVNSSPVVVATGTITIEDGQGVFYSSNTYGALFIRYGNNLFYQEFKRR
jgi:hypothetical protein